MGLIIWACIRRLFHSGGEVAKDRGTYNSRSRHKIFQTNHTKIQSSFVIAGKARKVNFETA